MPVISTVPAVLPLGVWGPGAAPSYTVRHLTLSPRDISAIPELSQALGPASSRLWQVEGVLRTLVSWFLARSAEARRIEVERGACASELQKSRSELEKLRQSTLRQADDLAHAVADRDRHRRERDGLRVLRVAASPGTSKMPAPSSSARHPPVRDPYVNIGYEAPSALGTAPSSSPSRPLTQVPMPTLGEVETGVPRYPSYCPRAPTGMTRRGLPALRDVEFQGGGDPSRSGCDSLDLSDHKARRARCLLFSFFRVCAGLHCTSPHTHARSPGRYAFLPPFFSFSPRPRVLRATESFVFRLVILAYAHTRFRRTWSYILRGRARDVHGRRGLRLRSSARGSLQQRTRRRKRWSGGLGEQRVRKGNWGARSRRVAWAIDASGVRGRSTISLDDGAVRSIANAVQMRTSTDRDLCKSQPRHLTPCEIRRAFRHRVLLVHLGSCRRRDRGNELFSFRSAMAGALPLVGIGHGARSLSLLLGPHS